MADPYSTRAPDPYAVLGRRVLDALGELAPGEGQLPAEADCAAVARLFADAPPSRILDVGGGSGATGLLFALAFPNARLIAIDPDRRIEASMPEGQASAISWTALALAQAAATRLGVNGHIRFVSGAFAASPRSGTAKVRAVGPDICASEPDFDLIVLDGSPDAETRAADLRLAASALAPSGVIAVRRVIGADGALVRAGVFEFLRYNPAFHFLHAPLADGGGTFGFLRHRSAEWFPGFDAPHPARAEDVGARVRDGLGAQIASMLGDRPVLELAVGAPVLGSGGRGASRALHLSAADLSARFVDPVIDQIVNALDHAPGSALFSGDLLDFASDELVTRLFARLADHGTPAVLAITPPGEDGVAGPASRPAARAIDFAVGQGLGVYGSAGLEFEAARHTGGGADATAAANSRYLSLLMFAAKSTWRDAAGRSLVEVSPIAAAQHEQVELQRIQTHAALRTRISEQHEARTEAERRGADLAERLNAAQFAAEVARQSHAKAIEANEAAMTQLRAELREQTDLGRTLHAALEEADAVVMRERERLRGAETDFAARLHAAEAALFDHRDRFQRDLSDLGERLDEAHQRAASADASIAEVRSELEARDATVADYRTRIGSLTSERANLEGQLRALMESMDQARGQLEALTAEANRARAEVETLRDAEVALGAERDDLARQLAQTRTRVDELTALRAAKNADHERLTQHLNAANSRVLNLRTERDDVSRKTEAAITALHDKLEAASNQVVANALREMDARLRLDGIDAHLALSQQAIDLYRADPAAFRAATLSYPHSPEDAPASDAAEASLVNVAKALHGRAADVSRELANILEAAGQRGLSAGLSLDARLQANEASHREAIEKLRAEFAERLATAERAATEKAGLDGSADGLDATIARIEAALGGAPPPSATPADQGRPASQRRRLEHILHVLDANAATKGRPAPALPPLKPDFLARPAAAIRPRLEPAAPPSAPSPAPPVAAIAPVGPGGWVDRNISTWAAPPEAPAPRTLVQRADGWVKAYPETYRLTRIQRDLRHRFEPMGLNPRVFDANYYLSQGPIAPHTNALRHYLLVGENDGRRPIPGFDPTWYRKHFSNPPAGADSLLGHFFSQGAEQGLSPSAELASLQTDAKKAGMSPLEFFFRWRPAGA
jgi:predicted nuclease with TOPRIM domain